MPAQDQRLLVAHHIDGGTDFVFEGGVLLAEIKKRNLHPARLAASRQVGE
jgi:hypothetical protein